MDVNALFARAEQAFVAGRYQEARGDLAQVQRLAGEHPDVLHLVALVERKRGQADAARDAFERAIALAPRDAKIRQNYGNFLESAGDADAALAQYDAAIAISPDAPEPHYGRVLVLHRLGRPRDALEALEPLIAANRSDPRYHSSRGAILRDLGRLEEAREAFDTALTLAPERAVALHGRARVAMERGEERASLFYKAALMRKPGDLAIIQGMCEALAAEGDPLGLELLGKVVAANPLWIEGQQSLARMRAEEEPDGDYARGFAAGLAAFPDNRALHEAYWQALAQGDRYEEALAAVAAARRIWPDETPLILAEAWMASEAGEAARADALFARLEGVPEARLAGARHALRSGDAGAAGALLERRVEEAPGDVAAWAHLDLAWRLLGDPRHQWLSGDEAFVSRRDLELDPAMLTALAELLRGLHRSRAHPIGQSLRGGTQTRGSLFDRTEPLLHDLKGRLEAGVAAHVAQLPPEDARHPLLRHRNARFAIKGSWSVRLAAQGFHVNHVHPEGVLSSACYISLPQIGGGTDAEDRAGWLDIGAPPAELGLTLPPLTTIRPEPGFLALFPSYLYHGTRPFADGERLTVAFDVVVS